jgi:hypothetical protein
MSKTPQDSSSPSSLPKVLPVVKKYQEWRDLWDNKNIVHPHPGLDAAFKTLCRYLATPTKTFSRTGDFGHQRAAYLVQLIYNDKDRNPSDYQSILRTLETFSNSGVITNSFWSRPSQVLKQAIAKTLADRNIPPIESKEFKSEDNYILKSWHQPILIEQSNGESKEETKVLGRAKPTLRGGDLLAQYYAEAHQANLTLTQVDASDSQENKHKHVSSTLKNMTDPSFLDYITEFCKREQKEERPYREAFLFNYAGVHTTLLVYIKEAKEHGFIYLNSTGIKYGLEQKRMKNFFKSLKEKTGALIYASEYSRQSGSYECHTDGVAVGSKLVRRNPITGEYPLEGRLLQELKSYSVPTIYDYSDTRLPLQFLTTVTREGFFKHYEIPQKEIDQIPNRDKYTYKLSIFGGTASHPDYVYNDIKSLKYADRMEVQFSVNELREKYPAIFTKTIEADFRKKAKSELKGQGYPNTFTKREGLSKFKEKYIKQLLGLTPSTEYKSIELR